MIEILHDLFVGVCYLLGIGCVGLFTVMVFLLLKGLADAMLKGKK